jgi:hypothetical protein
MKGNPTHAEFRRYRCSLRSAPNAHFSMRRVAQRVAAEIRGVHPLLASHMGLPEETWQKVEKEYFSRT